LAHSIVVKTKTLKKYKLEPIWEEEEESNLSLENIENEEAE